ncbi:MAG: type II secretion system F family protein [Rubricoccaceae bacterium]|nr:type II secretion system F family protein [Rubricoccaceae bacterium]
MREFRFTGLNLAGDPVRGTVYAPNKRTAQKRIDELAEKHDFAPELVEQRATFQYKVRHPSGTLIKGEQKAYTAEEVQAALSRVGLEVLRVDKKLIDVQRKPSSSDVVLFVRLAANMLRRNLPFDEILNLLITDTQSPALRQVMRDLNSDLKSGMDAKQAFLKHQQSLGKFTAFMLGLAAASGNMAEMFEATAKYLERRDKFKKSVRSAMITPSITAIAAIAALIWYVWYIVPSYARLFARFDIVLPPLTSASLVFADWMDANWWWVLTLSAAALVAFVLWSRTTKGRFIIHKYIIRVPYLGPLLWKLNLEVFCRVFEVLYSGAGESEEVMKIAAEATGNTYIEHQVKTVTVPMMVAAGTDLIEAMAASEVFTPMLLARFRSGLETGAVRETAEEMADFYQHECDLKLETAVETIKTATAIFISFIVAILTIISAESALISPTASDVMFQGR